MEVGNYSLAEMQSLYSIAPANWVDCSWETPIDFVLFASFMIKGASLNLLLNMLHQTSKINFVF